MFIIRMYVYRQKLRNDQIYIITIIVVVSGATLNNICTFFLYIYFTNKIEVLGAQQLFILFIYVGVSEKIYLNIS